MLIVHHLRPSRSERILWLLEEMEQPYELRVHDREMGRSPASLKAVHPLGKSPVLEDGDLVLAESGAIVAHLVARYGPGFAPDANSPEAARYQQWMHWCEGSLAAWLVMDLIVNGGVIPGVDPGPLPDMLAHEIGTALDWVESELEGQVYACGDSVTGADPMLTWVLGFAEDRGHVGDRVAIRSYLERVRARPAYQRAMEKAA